MLLLSLVEDKEKSRKNNAREAHIGTLSRVGNLYDLGKIGVRAGGLLQRSLRRDFAQKETLSLV